MVAQDSPVRHARAMDYSSCLRRRRNDHVYLIVTEGQRARLVIHTASIESHSGDAGGIRGGN